MTKILMERKPKITRATLKSFITKNKENLFILCKSTFDGMTDCIQPIKQVPHKATFTNKFVKHTLGINGVWLVGSSRDWFRLFEDELLRGIEVSNSCGNFIVAVIK